MNLNRIAEKILKKVNSKDDELKSFITETIKEEIKNGKYIIVYQEDEGWEEYCEILDVPEQADSITIYVADCDYDVDLDYDETIEEIEKMGFGVDECEDGVFIRDTSPCGQDCSIKISDDELSGSSMSEIIHGIYDDYDPDYEASLWIGEDGHGTNGAPYHIEDMK